MGELLPVASVNIKAGEARRRNMTKNELDEIFREKDVLKRGHFLLTSGFHSDTYLQCALALSYPDISERLAQGLCWHIDEDQYPDVVIGPALGGVTLAYEVARQLGVRALFTERENGKMTLRRGFHINPAERVLIVEDVLTTGGSVKEVMELVWQNEGDVAAVASLVDRSSGKLNLGAPVISLYKVKVKKWAPEKCPLCKKGIPYIKPGSKNVRP